MLERRLIWVLKGARAGDTAQALDLALQLGGRVEAKQMVFNASHNIPNWMMGARASHLTQGAQKLLRPPWPDMVVATGRRTAAVAAWIKKMSGGKTKLVQIGRPRMALSNFDLVLTTPQYGLPAAENVVEMPLPFVATKTVATDELEAFQDRWSQLPRPWILAVVGGGKFPVRLKQDDLERFGQALQKHAVERNGSLILLDSPRSAASALETMAAHVSVPHWRSQRGDGLKPYHPALELCDEMIVTSDSVSMVAEMIGTGKPTWVFRLTTSPWSIQWSAQNGIGSCLAKLGVLHPPRNVDGFMQNLFEVGMLGDVTIGQKPLGTLNFDDVRDQTVSRVKGLLLP